MFEMPYEWDIFLIPTVCVEITKRVGPKYPQNLRKNV